MRNTLTGISFERSSNLRESLETSKEFKVIEDQVYEVITGNLLGVLVDKHGLVKYLKRDGIDYRHHVEKKKLPDSAIIIFDKGGRPYSLLVFECRFQKVAGSVDEKIVGGPYWKKFYTKLVSELEIKVEYIYILSDWFKNGYRDELEYLRTEGIQYYFNEAPVNKVFPHMCL
jgi:hypothetical protein